MPANNVTVMSLVFDDIVVDADRDADCDGDGEDGDTVAGTNALTRK
jgi:hypothetical protein